MAASALICVGDVAPIVRRICEDALKMVPGEDLPPLISQQAVERIGAYLNRAREGGAEILVDGTSFSPKSAEGGYFMGPSVIDYRKGGQMSDEEVFGPTLELLGAESLKEALEYQKASPFGNAASIFTQNGRTAQEAVSSFSAGMCGINIGIPVPREPFSFGGWNASRFGWGDITGEASIDFWTQLKKVSMKWNPEDKTDWMS
jgi:malonate-semialdehyde dehydrogenase (acetylating)/methylmalonate-semialdehyde dehydrogenase